MSERTYPAGPPHRGFWNLEGCTDSDIVCSDGSGFSITYSDLRESVQRVARALNELGPRKLGFIRCTTSPEWLVGYLASLTAGHVPLLLPAGTSDALFEPLLRIYGPSWVWDEPVTEEPRTDIHGVTARVLAGFRHCKESQQVSLHPALGCLLSTSGSTGSPKLVRLSYAALDANARSIASYLDLGPDERALTTLPTSYSYGLSVVNSHLSAGAAVVCRNVSPVTREFREVITREEVTSLAGVPSWYQMLLRTGFDKIEAPSIRTLTQAGGRLDERTKRTLLAMSERKGIRFFVMYGQTEATARISYVPPDELVNHLDSIGIPIPGGRITLDPVTSEIIYHGANVMMGYAESAADLSKPDQCGGVLRTGDIGVEDASGYFRITGRLKRVVKLSGNRFGLDEVENELITRLGVPVAVTGRDERLGIFIEGGDTALVEVATALLSDVYGLHHSLFRTELLDKIPLLPTGKKDYGDLLDRLG